MVRCIATTIRTCALALGAALFVSFAHAQEIRVESKVQPPTAADNAQPAKAKATRAAKVQLGAPSPDELAPVNAPAKKGTPLKVGFSRPIAALDTEGATGAKLTWDDTASGGRIAALSVTSPGAAAVRLGLRVNSIPAPATLRFYAPGGSQAFEVAGQEILDTLARNEAAGDHGPDARVYWSPPIEGDTLAMEIELPAGVRENDVHIAMPKLSHLVTSASTGFTTLASASCENDAMCYTSTWGSQINAVARMLFNDSTYSYLCTGTLLADNDSTTTIPYFLSANHCISTQTVASTLTTYWFYRSTACNSGVIGSYQTRTGGATLLYASANSSTPYTDTSFMRLNSAPPAGAVYAGWLANGNPASGSITGIHHPGGDMEKISFGTINAYGACTAPVNDSFNCSSTSPASSQFYNVAWSSGVVEPGSSGSGLFLQNGQYLVGQLYGGSSSCTDPTSGDVYGRFDVAYNVALSQWLNPAPPTTQSLVVVRTTSGGANGTVTSSPTGINCGSACAANFTTNSTVSLSAAAAAGSAFTGWSGACTGTGACNVTMNGTKTVTATFAPQVLSSAITVTVQGNGGGTVTSSPAGISCTSLCSANFTNGTAVTLTATPSTGTRFLGWIGGGCSGTGPCSFTMSNATAIVAPFDATPTNDLNGDGKADLFWTNTADGSTQAWLMNGLTATSIASLVGPGGWRVTQLGDLNNDGRVDLLLTNSDGTVVAWLMNGLTVSASATLAGAGSGWSIAQVADLDGNGTADILWQHTDGTVQAWLMNGLSVTASATLAGAGSGWSISKVADLNGDGKADIIWQHTDGTVQAWLMNGLSATQTATLAPAGSGWSVVLTADLNGDRKADLVWQNTDGSTQAWLMNGLAPTSMASFTAAGSGWTPVRAGDVNADGKADLFWQHTSGASQAWLMNGTSVTSIASLVPAATGWSVARVVDLDGDGAADVLWRHTSGAVQAWLMNGLSVKQTASLVPAGTYLLAP